MPAIWSRRRSIAGTQPAPSSIDAEAQVAVALEDAVEHERADEQLGRVVQADHVLAADVLAAAEPVAGHRPAGVHERLVELQRVAADVEQRRAARPRPPWPRTGRGRRGRASGRRAARWGIQTAPRPSSTMWSTSATAASTSSRAVAPTPSIRGSPSQNVGHRPVVGPGRAGRDVGLEAGVEHDAGAERGEHELALEAEQVERLAALGGVERAERLVALGAR